MSAFFTSCSIDTLYQALTLGYNIKRTRCLFENLKLFRRLKPLIWNFQFSFFMITNGNHETIGYKVSERIFSLRKISEEINLLY